MSGDDVRGGHYGICTVFRVSDVDRAGAGVYRYGICLKVGY
jgi:hypothetical protein